MENKTTNTLGHHKYGTNDFYENLHINLVPRLDATSQRGS